MATSWSPHRRLQIGAAFLAAAAAATAGVVVVSALGAASRPLLRPSRATSPLTLTTRWAGYVVRPRAQTASFARVAARWRQPAVSCAGRGSSASIWVGLGGAGRTSRSVEQIGSAADCADGVVPRYSLWYENFPAPPVAIRLRVRPGDRLAAWVAVRGGTVSLALTNMTTGRRFARAVTMQAPETDSAEWIVEAPGLCLGLCGQLLLADFGRVDFTGSSATTRGAPAGVDGPAWASERLGIGTQGRALATPTSLGPDGSSFGVRYTR